MAPSKYARSSDVTFDRKTLKSVEDKKLRRILRTNEKHARDAASTARHSELLLTEEQGFMEAESPMERTYKVTQSALKDHVDLNTRRKMFTLDLPETGPFRISYTRNGRHLLLGGAKGHVSAFDWQAGALHAEHDVQDTVRDVCWLHNESLYAVAQSKNVYIYDQHGAEVHALRKHIDVNRLTFLPHHFLLASVGNAGYLKYQDTATGELIAEIRTKLGSCNVMNYNSHNAVIHLGHNNGCVTLWSPTLQEPLVKMQCHKGPVQAVAIDQGGYYMATAGLDAQVKIWDVRTFKPVHAYFAPTPPSHLSISQTGLLAVGHGAHVTVWRDAFKTKQNSPYMHELLPNRNRIFDMRFCPYDDVLGVGHATGFTSLVIPGAGQANYDAREANPFASKSQRREQEVHQVLDKIPASMISLVPVVGRVQRSLNEATLPARKLAYEASRAQEKLREKTSKDSNEVSTDELVPGPNDILIKDSLETPSKDIYAPKKRERNRVSSVRRFLNKQKNVIDAKKVALRARLAAEREQKRRQPEDVVHEEKSYVALDRFKRNRHRREP